MASSSINSELSKMRLRLRTAQNELNRNIQTGRPQPASASVTEGSLLRTFEEVAQVINLVWIMYTGVDQDSYRTAAKRSHPFRPKSNAGALAGVDQRENQWRAAKETIESMRSTAFYSVQLMDEKRDKYHQYADPVELRDFFGEAEGLLYEVSKANDTLLAILSVVDGQDQAARARQRAHQERVTQTVNNVATLVDSFGSLVPNVSAV